MKRSGRSRGDRARVESARRQVALALGRDPDYRDSFIEPPKSSLPPPPTAPANTNLPVASRGIAVLSIGEAAARLGVSRAELEAMIDSHKIEVLPTGYTRMVPTREVDRINRQMPGP